MSNLETIDFSCELARDEDFESARWPFLIAEDFTHLRVLCLNTSLLPRFCFENKRRRDYSKYENLTDLLPCSIEKLHLTGQLTYIEACELFGQYFTQKVPELPHLYHISSDFPIRPLLHALGSRQARLRKSQTHFEIVERPFAEKHISPDAGNEVEALWNYPNVKAIKGRVEGTETTKATYSEVVRDVYTEGK